MYNIMVVDDEKDIVKAIEIYLKTDNYNVLKAYNGYDALELMEKNKIDLFLVDIMMEGMDGLELTQKIREVSNARIIILSAKSELNDKVMGLNLGADDYMTKPFNLEELVARANILTKRIEKQNKNNISHKSLSLESHNYQAFIDGNLLNLTKTEFKILELLMSNPKQVFTKENLYEYCQGDYYLANDNSINVHISNLRKKLKKYTDEDYIETVWGIGFKLAWEFFSSYWCLFKSLWFL